MLKQLLDASSAMQFRQLNVNSQMANFASPDPDDDDGNGGSGSGSGGSGGGTGGDGGTGTGGGPSKV